MRTPARGGHDGERSEPPGKRSAQRAKRAEARGIPARRAETAQRARQGSPVAKRRAQSQEVNGRDRLDRRQCHRNVPDIVVLLERKERIGQLLV